MWCYSRGKGILKKNCLLVQRWGAWAGCGPAQSPPRCYIWYSKDGLGRGRSPSRPILAVPNVTAHPSTASVPTSYYLMWQYNCLWTLKGKERPTKCLSPESIYPKTETPYLEKSHPAHSGDFLQNKCIGVDTITPVRRQVLPLSEWLYKFHRRQTN